MKVKEMVLGAVLTSLALIIPLSFGGLLGVTIPPFSATLASHVPSMLAMTISPWVAFMVGAGSALGFLMKLGVVVGARASMHTIFATIGAILIKKGYSFKKVLFFTAPIHAITEALVVIPFGFSLYDMGVVIGVGTFLHHIVDSFIAIGIYSLIATTTGLMLISK
jgi:niacin transporter